MNQLRTDRREASWLLIIMICAKVFFTDIMIFVHTSGTAAFVQVLWCIIIEWILFFVIYYLFSKCKGKDIFEAISLSFGKTGLVIWGAVVFFIQILNLGAILKIYSETLSSLTLTTAPIWFLSGFIIICMLFAGYSDTQGLFGVCTSFGVFILSLFFLILFLDLSHYDVTNVFPALGNGWKNIIMGINGISVFNDLFFLYYISSGFKDKKSVKKTGATVLAVTSFVTLAATLCYTFAVPYPLSKKFYMPVFQISSDITADVVIQRAEALFLVMWILSIFIYMSAHFYFLTLTYQKTLLSSDRKGIIPISIAIIISTSSLWQNINQASPVLSVIKEVSSVVFLSLLILSFGIGCIRQKREDKGD